MKEENKKEKKPKSKARKIIEWVVTGLLLAIFAVLGLAQIDGLVNKNKHYGQQIRFGYATFIVQTDSMEPKYKVKNALITYLDDPEKIYQDFQKGKEIDLTFFFISVGDTEYTTPLEHPELTKRTNKSVPSDLNVPMTHRLMEVHINNDAKKGEGKYTFITAGINTKSKNMGWEEGDPDLTIDQYQAFTEKELLGRVVIGSAFLGGIFGFISSVWGLLILLLIPAFYLIITSVIDIFKAYKEPEEVTEGAPKQTPNGERELSEEDKKRLKEELLKEMMNKKKGD